MASGKVFGRPLDKLLEADRKIRPTLQVPLIVYEAVRCINRHGVDNEGIFRISGNKERVQAYREAYDKGEHIDFVKEKAVPFDVSSLLKQFLRELPDPILLVSQYEKWIAAHDIADRDTQLKTLKGLLDALPPANINVLRLLIPFFARIAMNVNLNKMESGNLSKVVAPNMLWKEGTDSIEYLVHSSKINDIVKLLIDDHKYFFSTSGEEFAQFANVEAKLFGHIKSVQCICVGSSTQIWSCDSIGAIKIWDIETFTKVKEIDSSQGRLFNMTRVGNYIWTLSGNNAKVWDPQTATCVKELPGFSYTAIQVDSNTLWVGSENKIVVYNAEFSHVKNIDVPGNVVMTMCLDPSGKFVWAGTTDKRVNIHVFDAQTGQLHKELTGAHKRKINSFAISQKSQIWSAGDDGTICIWDCEKFDAVKKIEGQHQGAVYGVTALGNFMWSYGWDTIIRVWDLKTNDIVCKIEDQHSDCVSSMCVIFSPPLRQWLGFTSSWDKSICGFAIGAIHNVAVPYQEGESKVVVTRPSSASLSNAPPVVITTSEYPLATEEDAKVRQLLQKMSSLNEEK